MSLALKVFTDNFLKGMQIGTHWQDKAEDREIKKSTLKYQLAKMEQDAAYKRATLAETARRNSAYVTQSGAYADYLRQKGASLANKGKGGPGGPDPNVQRFLLDDRVNEPGLATPPPAAAAPSVAAPEQTEAPPQPPPANDASEADDGYRRGGSVRPRTGKYAGGGSVGSGLELRLKYQVRRDEQSARVAQPTTRLSRPLRAPTFDPVPRMARGGPVALKTRPPMMPPGVGAGTTGPGSGFGQVAAPPPGSRYANGGPVDEMAQANDAMVRRNTGMADQSMAARRAGGAAGGSANGATGSGGDAAGGVSGTGGVGGSATDGAGGSAAAGVGGDDGGTYRRGGMVSRYADGGTVADPVENLWNSYYHPQQSQPAQGGAGGRTLSSFASTAMGGINKAIEGKGAYNTDRTPTTPQPRPTIQRTSSMPYDGGVPGTDSDTGYARGGNVRRFADGGDVVIGPDGYPVPQEPLWPPTGDWAREGTMEKIRQTRLGRHTTSQPGSEDQTPPVTEEDQAAEARAARERNPSKRNWVPPRRDVRPPFAGEEARADETPSTPTYEPGDSGPKQPPEQVMPPVTVSAPRGGGGGGGPPKRRLLGDQQRTAAYDPEADRMDPRNTGITEPGGAVNERVWRATPEAHPDAYPDDNKGMFGERLDRPGPHPVAADATTGSAINIGAPTTSTAAPDNYAAKGASRYASNTFQGDDQHALFAGKGAPTHAEMADVFKVVDPDGKMPMHERMIAAQKMSHDYWMSKGDPKQADQAAFEIGQFGNTMAREHGAKAAKAIQAGDQKTGINELMAGYGWLPDGGTPEVQNNAIIIRDQTGKVTTTIPLQQGTMLNLALGMSTGQLGWDVMHAAAGKQVAGGSAAQPQAASAGPPPVSAAPQGAQPPSAGGQGAGEPAPQIAQAPPAPPRPAAPPVAPPGAPSAAPPGAPPVAPPAAPPGPPPAQMGPEGGGAISTAPPTAPAAPAPAPQVPPTARAPAPAPTSQTPPSGQGQGVQPTAPTQPEQKTPEQLKTEAADEEQKHWAKNPYAPVTEKNSAEQKRDDAIDLERRRAEHSIQQVIQAANEHGLAGKGKLSTAVTQVIAAKKKAFEDKVKEIQTDFRTNQAERTKDNQPRPISLSDETTIDGTFTTRAQTLAKAPPTSVAGQFRDNSVLRYATGEDQQTIKSIASNIWQHNKGLTSQQALDLALTSTSIMRPSDKEKEPVGQNRQKGAGATRFRPSNRGDKNLTYLTFGDGTSIKVDKNTYTRIMQQHSENWKQWSDSQTEAGQKKERDKKMGVNWNTAGAALRASTALVPGLPLITEGIGGVVGSFNRGR